jgi:hypothetical protein
VTIIGTAHTRCDTPDVETALNGDVWECDICGKRWVKDFQVPLSIYRRQYSIKDARVDWWPFHGSVDPIRQEEAR